MKKNRRNRSRWVGLGRSLIILFLIILFFNAMALFIEIRRDMIYDARSYGLNALNDYFDRGEYQEIYEYTIRNKYAEDELSVDVSQYEAFGRYYHAYALARIYEDNGKYLARMAEEKEKITWKKILTVIDELESEMNEKASL